jgi:tripartite-type tricarboxylate transporter receptor subunit TctC
MKLKSGNSFRLLIGGALALASSIGFAQAWPNKPMRLVVPYGPGGAPDVIARTLSPRLGEIFGQQVLVDNRPGAGGAIAAEHVAKSPADGYTFFVADTGHFAINPALPAKDLKELAALSKVKPLNFASPGVGTKWSGAYPRISITSPPRWTPPTSPRSPSRSCPAPRSRGSPSAGSSCSRRRIRILATTRRARSSGTRIPSARPSSP